MATLTDDIRAMYPWAVDLGLLPLIEEMVRNDASAEEILAAIRLTPEWKAQFPAFYAEDGSKRFGQEAQYMQYVDDLRDVMKEFGVYDAGRESPLNYIGLIENGIDPNEFRERFTTYRALEAGTSDLRDAFYVYAGLTLTVDDLYRMTVDPGFQQEVVGKYDSNVIVMPMTYELYLQRSTERMLMHLAEAAGAAVDKGIIPESMLKDLINMDPDTAMGWADVIQTSAGKPLSFDELNRAFQYAMLGSAAMEQGFALPGKERIQEFVQAGVTRASATRAYSAFAQQRFGLAGMAQRAGLQDIDQALFEEALLLQSGEAINVLNKATDRERAWGRAGGGFGQSLEGSRVTQMGR